MAATAKRITGVRPERQGDMDTNRKFTRTATMAVLAALPLLWAAPALARNPNPGILPPHASSHGATLGEWAARWWQWALGVPADRNPLTDATGEFCGEDQSGPVWFVAGTFGTSVERSCTVPTGKALFMPVFNWIFGSGVFDCDPTVPGVECDVPTLRAAAAANTEAADILEVTIDGVALDDVEAYRAQSPVFPLTYPENSVLGLPAGEYSPQVADGYWLMLAPLSRGEHTVHIHVRAPETIFGLIEFDFIAHLTVR